VEQYYNGYIIIRRRKVEMKWLGIYAAHILENYKKDSHHDLTHLEIQNVLRVAKYKKIKRSRWQGIGQYNGKQYKVIFALTKKYAVIITGYQITKQ